MSEINAALAALQQELPRITKDLTAKVKSERTGAQYSYSYADLALISRELLPLLGKHGLSFTSRPTLLANLFVLAYELRHNSGEQIDGVYPLPERGSPQEIGSAITYARRYSLCAVTGIAPDDEDHDAIVAEKAERRRRRDTSAEKTVAAPKVKPMLSSQQKQMQDLFNKLGMEDRATRLKYATDIVGRPLRSATEMSHDEADTVIARAKHEVEMAAQWPATAKDGGAE